MNLQYLLTGLMLFLVSGNTWAVDSYRFMHVTIDTPWMIFIFLLCIVMFPFILSAVLHWHFAGKKRKEDEENDETNG